MITEENIRDLPVVLRATVEQIMDEFIVSRDPQIIDLYLDQHLYNHLITVAREKRATVLETYLSVKDLANIKTFYVLNAWGEVRNSSKKHFFPRAPLPWIFL